MKILGNILWLLFGGLATALEYFFYGAMLCLTIIGFPLGFQLIKLGVLALWPFGSTVVTRPEANGCGYIILDIVWCITGGFLIALTHALFGLLCCITIIGIPFGMQHFKMAGLALAPFGKDIQNN